MKCFFIVFGFAKCKYKVSNGSEEDSSHFEAKSFFEGFGKFYDLDNLNNAGCHKAD